VVTYYTITNDTVLCVKQEGLAEISELQQKYRPECTKTQHIETQNQFL